MAADIVLTDQEAKITNGSLKVDKMVEAGIQFSDTSNHLKFDARGLVISSKSSKTQINGGRILSGGGHFDVLRSDKCFYNKVHLGAGRPHEPGIAGEMKIQNGMGNETISADGKSGVINCTDIHLNTIGNLVEIIKKLQNDIEILKKK